MEVYKLSFVIPCYNSSLTIEGVVKEIQSVILSLEISSYEIILVNDGSPDDVWDKIQQLSGDDRIIGINLSRNFGQHAALLAGYASASGDLVVSLDDDGQTPIEELQKLLCKIDEGYDVVYAYYDEIKQNGFRRFGSWMANKMSHVFIGSPKDFKGSSFYVAKKYIIEEIVRYNYPYPYLFGLVYRTTHSVGNVLTHHRKRVSGQSGYTFKTLMKLWMNGFTAFSVKPLRIGTCMGVVTSAFGFVVAMIIVIRKIINPDIAAGWSSTISIIMIIGGLILVMLGLLGEYIGRIYICINKTPQYVIKEKIN